MMYILFNLYKHSACQPVAYKPSCSLILKKYLKYLSFLQKIEYHEKLMYLLLCPHKITRCTPNIFHRNNISNN